MIDLLRWYPELRPHFQRPATLAFSHLSAVHWPSDLPIHVWADVAEGAETFRLDDQRLIDWASAATAGSIAVVETPEPNRFHSDALEALMEQLREPLGEARTRGASIWFASRYPLSRFPALAGSSLLVDAETVRLRALTKEQTFDILSAFDIETSTKNRISERAAGSRALVSLYVSVEQAVESNAKKRTRAERGESAIALAAWAELGPDLLALLDHWVYESGLTSLDEFDFPNEAVMSSLVASGLVGKETSGTFSLIPFINRSLWVDELERAVSQCVAAPESWSRVASELFSLERELRANLAGRMARDAGLAWRQTELANYSAGLLELARRDGIAKTSDVNDLRSPLDWMQFSDLLHIAIEKAQVDPVLNLKQDEWKRVRDELLPIRHRVAHMRLLRLGDVETVRRVRRLLDVRMGRVV